MVLVTFALTAVCTVFVTSFARIEHLPTMHDIDNEIFHFSQSIHRDFHTDYQHTDVAFDRTFDRRNLECSDTETNSNGNYFSGKTFDKKEVKRNTLKEFAVSSHFPNMHGSISHIVNAQKLQNNEQKKSESFFFCSGQTKQEIKWFSTLFLPSSKMSSTLATIQIAVRDTFAIVLTRIRLTTLDLVVSRCQFVFEIEI